MKTVFVPKSSLINGLNSCLKTVVVDFLPYYSSIDEDYQLKQLKNRLEVAISGIQEMKENEFSYEYDIMWRLHSYSDPLDALTVAEIILSKK